MGLRFRRDNKQTILASLKSSLPTAPCRCLPGPHRCRDPDRFLAIGLTFVGLMNRLSPIRQWKVRLHGAFSIPSRCLGLAPEWSKLPPMKHGYTSTLSGDITYNTPTSWRSQDNEQECELSANLVSIYARRFSPGKWSCLGPGSEKWYSLLTHNTNHTENGTELRSKWW